mmetsp:Transcript_14075/g.31608  ORF Transcript_14075/g.31608 Transcript_14075/m.31608 type:complete len:112 (+) Transcript_14075:42-377(+)
MIAPPKSGLFTLLYTLTGLFPGLEKNFLYMVYPDTSYPDTSPASRMLCTFLTPRTNFGSTMHKFTPADPLGEVQRHGWWGRQEDLGSVCVRYNRPLADNVMDGYCFVIVDV